MTDAEKQDLRELALDMLAHIQTMRDKEVAHIQADAAANASRAAIAKGEQA